jgi:four helix bundle protein
MVERRVTLGGFLGKRATFRSPRPVIEGPSLLPDENHCLTDMKEGRDHKDLAVWHKAVALAGQVYAATRRLPREERDGLGAELRRAAVSIPSSIAEGAARRSKREFVQFLQRARGSLSELETHAMISIEQKLLAPEDAGLEQIAEIAAQLQLLIRTADHGQREAHAKACNPQSLPPKAVRSQS